MDCCTKLLDCMRLDHQDEQHFITLLDSARASSDLADLDLYILRAIFGSQKTRGSILLQYQTMPSNSESGLLLVTSGLLQSWTGESKSSTT